MQATSSYGHIIKRSRSIDPSLCDGSVRSDDTIEEEPDAEEKRRWITQWLKLGSSPSVEIQNNAQTFHRGASDVQGFVLLHILARKRLSSLDESVQRKVNALMDRAREEIGIPFITLNGLRKQHDELRKDYVPNRKNHRPRKASRDLGNGLGVMTSARSHVVGGDDQQLPAGFEKGLGLDVPSNEFLVRIGEEVSRARWTALTEDRQDEDGDGGLGAGAGTSGVDMAEEGGENPTEVGTLGSPSDQAPFPCAYCSESDAVNLQKARRRLRNDKGSEFWLKALRWTYKMDDASAVPATEEGFLDVVSSRKSRLAEVLGIRFMVDLTGGSTRIVLVEFKSVFDVIQEGNGSSNWGFSPTLFSRQEEIMSRHVKLGPTADGRGMRWQREPS